MKARCTGCNAGIEVDMGRGATQNKTCTCGGTYLRMRSRQVDGEAPLPGFTKVLFGKVYHVVYTGGGGGEWLWDKEAGKFVGLVKESI